MFTEIYNKLFPTKQTDVDMFYLLFENVYKVFLCNITYEVMGADTSIDDIPKSDPKSLEFLNKVKQILDETKEIQIKEHEPLTYAQLLEIEHNIKLNKQRTILNNFYNLRRQMLDGKKLIIDKHGDFVTVSPQGG